MRLKKASVSLRGAIPFFIASVIHHWEWLESNLPKHHPFFTSKIYQGKYAILWKDKVMLSNKVCPISKLRCSGAPVNSTIARNVNINTEFIVKESERITLAENALPGIVADAVMSKLGSAHNVLISNDEQFVRSMNKHFPNFGIVINHLSNQFNGRHAQEALIGNRATSEEFETFFREIRPIMSRMDSLCLKQLL